MQVSPPVAAPLIPLDASRGAPLALGAAGLTIAMWASAFVVIRGVGPEVPPGPLALARLAIAALVLTPFALPGVRPLLPRGAMLIRVVAYSLLWFAGYNLALIPPSSSLMPVRLPCW